MRRLLCFFAVLLTLVFACAGASAEEPTGSMSLAYAEHFFVETYAGGAARLRAGEQDFLLLPAGASVPAGLEALPQISIPAGNIYLASSSAPDLFLRMDALDTVRFTSTDAPSWRIPEIRDAVDGEQICYIGKYSAPDYEALLTEGCGLVVENTMILHSPATKEKLEALGFPVLIEYSSYEPHPLGRVEWIKLYGLLCGRLPEAEAFFDEQVETFQTVEHAAPLNKTVAFFHITANGGVVVRRQADYITRMIELAGAIPAVTDLPVSDSALSTATIQMESFYAQARDADVLIYNATVAGDVTDLESFLAQNPLLKDFKAVREGNVWCTEMSMFQRSSAAADMIAEIRAAVSGETGENLRYLHRIE